MQQTFWTRMKGLIRSPARGTEAPDDTVVPADEETGEMADPANGGMLSRWRRSEELIERLETGYGRVTELMVSIQQHQRKQEGTAEQISSSLEQVSGSLTALESNGRDQAATLGRIADELKTGNERAGRWEAKLDEFPELARAQRDALCTVSSHLEAVVRHDVQLTDSLSSFKDAVSTLSDATTASSVAVKNLQMSALEAQADLGALIRQQNKRFSMLFALTLLLVVAVVTIGLALWWTRASS